MFTPTWRNNSIWQISFKWVETTNWTTFPYDTPRTSWSFPFVLPGTRQDRACKGHPAEVLGEVETLEHGQKTAPSRKGPSNGRVWTCITGVWVLKIAIFDHFWGVRILRVHTLFKLSYMPRSQQLFGLRKTGRHSLSGGCGQFVVFFILTQFAETCQEYESVLQELCSRSFSFCESIRASCWFSNVFFSITYFSCFRVLLGSVSRALFSHSS